MYTTAVVQMHSHNKSALQFKYIIISNKELNDTKPDFLYTALLTLKTKLN